MCDLDDFLAQTHPRLITELSLVGRNETLLAVAGPGVSGGKIDHETNKERIASFAKVEVLVEAEDSRAAPGAQVHVLVQLEPGDLDRLAADPHRWLTFWGVVVPVALTVPEPA